MIAYLSTRAAGTEAYHHRFPIIGIVLTLIAAGLAWYAWATGPTKVLWSTGAREVVTPETPSEQQVVNVVDEMAIASGLPRPRVWIVPDEDPNAFATGYDERDSHVAVTEGLLRALDRSELQAVVAHEMGHVRNLDVRLMTLLAALVGSVALIGDGVGRMMWHGGRLSSGGRSRDNDKKSDGAGPDCADCGHQRGSAHRCIADPTGRASAVRPSRFSGILATHPPMAERMARLEAMAYGM